MSDCKTPSMSCPSCSSSMIVSHLLGKHQYVDKFEYSYLECLKCDLVFVFPIPSSEILVEIYTPSNYANTYVYNRNESKDCDPLDLDSSVDNRVDNSNESFQTKKDKQALFKLLFKYKRENNYQNLLDFGCGNGNFSIFARKCGYQVTAYEPLPQDVNLLSKKTLSGSDNIEILTGEIGVLLESGRKFDIIFLADVLEHLPYPIETLCKLRHLLSSKGVFMILSPLESSTNIGTIFLKLYKNIKKISKASTIANNPPYHLFLFNKRSLIRLINNASLQMINYTPYSIDWPFTVRQNDGSIKALAMKIIGKTNIVIGESILGRLLNLQNRAIVIAKWIKE
ncbi:MAG: class I SAM-dependent methyltransferase [Oligoflexia bacterium]|nr:class I SAM-dependent methyltransferase [Oligoflexia bacterium]